MVNRDRLRTATLWAGPLAAAVSLLGIVVATLLGPNFAWTANALSDLGARGEPTALLFNGTLILTGLLGLPFAWRVFGAAETALQRAGIGIVALSFVALALVGVFPLPEPEHGPVAVAFFLLFTYGFFVVGTGDVLAGRRKRGLATIWLGVAHPTAWLVWLAMGLEGIAIPEFVGAVLVAAWVGLQFRSVRA